jgi:uncharacterized integral membrane protein
MRNEDDLRGDDDRGDGWRERREGPSGKLIGAAIAGVLLLVFILQNTNATEVNLLFWDHAMPLWILIAIAAVLGFAIGWSLGRGSGRRAAYRRMRG